MKFLGLLVVPYIVIMAIFLLAPRPSAQQTTPQISQATIPSLKPAPSNMDTKIAHAKEAAVLLSKIESNTDTSRKTLEEFYKRFKISPTPDTLGVNDAVEPTTDNQQLTTYTQPTTNIGIGELTENPVRTTYTIAFLGDSMTDTLTPFMGQLQSLLKAKYPTYSFALLNFGQGSTDLESGIKRLTEGSTYNGKYMPSVLSYRPDILVVESFAFNPWSRSSSDLDRQWLDFAKLYTSVKQDSADTKILFATTIGPNATKFGDGKLNWSASQKKDKTDTIKAYLTNLIRFTNSQHLPLADTYSASVDAIGNGKIEFITPSDYIHPSVKGAELYFEKVLEKIVSEKMIPE